MTPDELLEKARELTCRAHDARRYQYDRDAAIAKIVELMPEIVETFHDLLIDLDALQTVAERAQIFIHTLMFKSPASSSRWLERMPEFRELHAALERWDEVRGIAQELLEAARHLSLEGEEDGLLQA